MSAMPDERPNRWVVDPEHPKGRLVAMTDAEWAQNKRDQVAGVEIDRRMHEEQERIAVEQAGWTDAEREDWSAGNITSFARDASAHGVPRGQMLELLRWMAQGARERRDEDESAAALSAAFEQALRELEAEGD